MSGTFKDARDFLLAHAHDHATAYRDFRWPELDKFNWALDWFDQIASGPRAHQTALWVMDESGGDSKLTFKQLSQRSSQVANYFRSLGVRRGDRMMLMLGNVPALWETILGAMKVGAVITPTTTLLTSGELGERIRRGAIRHIVADSEYAGRFADQSQECTRIAVGGPVSGWLSYDEAHGAATLFEPDGPTSANDPLQLYFTSGTTSQPKLVVHSHATYPVGHLSTMYWIGLRPGDIHCNISAPGWAKHAWSCVFAPWNAEATVFAANQPRFNARTLLEALVRATVTTFCAPPTVWRMLVLEDLGGFKTSLREVVSAGEPLNPEIIARVKRMWGLTVREGYGQTETSALVGYPSGAPVRVGSMGKTLPGYRIAILDPNRHETTEGELCVLLDPRPTGVMTGYQLEDGATDRVQGPFHRTGDVVSKDEEEYLTFIGRMDDVFKSSDYRLSPFELESALMEHPDVVECAVVPSPDPLRLAVPKAFIVLKPGADATPETAVSIFRHVRRVLAPYKRVRLIQFSQLPKTVSGKIRRVELRHMEAVKVQGGERAPSEFREEDFPELKAGEPSWGSR
jgi:acetyl-CoA synthetase